MRRAVEGYRIEAEIGRGAQGAVYRARDPAGRRAVALKALPAGPAAEAALAAGALDHPNVLPVRAAFVRDGAVWLVLEHVAGGTLADLLARGLPAATRALGLLRQVAAALDHAAAHGVVHRDVSPANVLIGRGDRVLLTDFAPPPAPGTWLGTPEYIAPERLRGAEATPAADRYALAAVAFEALTGRPPFPRPDRDALLAAHLAVPPPAASALRPGLPVAVDGVLARGLAKDPAARHPSAAALCGALADALGPQARAVATRRSTPAMLPTRSSGTP